MPEARSRSWVTYAMIIANVVMFAVEVLLGASPISPTSQKLLDLGGSFPPRTLGGEWWRLGSAMFLHVGILHVGLNMLCLYQARLVEALYGHLGFAVVYWLAGLGGGIASLVAGPSNAVTVGASGAVFGVYGAFGAFLVLRRSQMPEEAWSRAARSLGSFLVINLVFGLTVAGISVSGHVGGVIVGFVVGAALLAGARAAGQRTVRALGLLVAGVGLTALAVMTLRATPLVPPVVTRFEEVEDASVTRYNAALQRAGSGELKNAEFAELLERDVLAPFRQARAELAAAQDIPKRIRPALRKLDAYATARIATWEVQVAALRETDPEKHAALLATYEARKAEAAAALEAYVAEAEKLKR
ncbi:MAG TPA: rhomboid family intramembrane serine protease [Kofleriaceae bacterium]|nr:rhomboid family intramembrane serine protease [Kofleriaceae bacterium]